MAQVTGSQPAWVHGMTTVLLLAVLLAPASPAGADHQGHEERSFEALDDGGSGIAVPGASFRIFVRRGAASPERAEPAANMDDTVVRTVLDALTMLVRQRAEFPRVDEAVRKDLLDRIIIEPTVVNREGKTFAFLVARTADPGRVRLLISASALYEGGYVGHPDQLAPVLAREFQWVISKADTAPRAKTVAIERDLKQAPIRTDQELPALSPEERRRTLHGLFNTYLKTVDDLHSLEGQPYYETGTTRLVAPAQPDSAIKYYDVLIRDALERIVRDPYFAERTPKAVRSLLNGKIWNVAFVKIDQRDWATRTRVLPEEKAVTVGKDNRRIQPAAILLNTYRTAAPDDPFYRETQGLPMGALSAEQLARVIAWEIEQNIVEKSMSGHVAQDALTAPK